MRTRRVLAGVAVACLVVSCARPDAEGISSRLPASPASVHEVAGTLEPVSAPPRPVGADLPFPPPRLTPIEPPDDPTPAEVIDAFLRLVHDSQLTYHADGMARWLVDGDELLTAMSIDHAAQDRHLTFRNESGSAAEAIVRGASAAVRQGSEGWQPEDAELLARFGDLSTAIVIGDLGRERDGRGYRLVVDADFDQFPASAIANEGVAREITELVVDETGSPLGLTYHRWSGMAEPQAEMPRGVAVFRFDRVGDALAIPPLPVAGSTHLATPSGPPLVETALHGERFRVEMPDRVEAVTRELSAWAPNGGSEILEVRSLVASTSDGGRFEAGTAEMAADGLTVEESLAAARNAILSRMGGSELLGFRFVEIDGAPGQEIVAVGTDQQQRVLNHRIRTLHDADQLIVLTVTGPPGVVGSAQADRFLDSITLVVP